jgi:alpha-tubulin suppressor-like RCC1 family protein
MNRAAPWLLCVASGCGFDAVVLSAGSPSDAAIEARGDAGAADDGGVALGAGADATSAATDAGADGPLAPDAAERGNAIGVFAGQAFTCALSGGKGWCFGANVDGALGSGDLETHLSPVALATPSGFDALSGGENHACGLEHGTGAVFCWGYNASGQLGQGDVLARDVPVRVPLGARATSVAAGYNHTCAVLAEGSLWCWGDDTEGQLGQNDPLLEAGASASVLSPVRVGTGSGWTRVAGGQGHTCAIQAPGTMWCWGRNTRSETGTDPSVEQTRAPKQTGTFTDWTDLDLGQDASCGIRADGSLWCWGDNSFGQLGAAPQSNPVTAPAQVGTDTGYVQISIDTFSACGRKTDGTALCWGRNAEGQLGVGDTRDRYAPAMVGAPGTWASVSVGRFHSCFGRADGSAYCAGENSMGQLGVGDTVRRSAPARVSFPM